jgi:hypothetical protein
MKIWHLTILASVLAACGGGGDDGGPDAAAATCADYCTAIQANCTAANTQYTSPDQCMAACSAFAQGSPGAMSGNNLECRTYHAGAAEGDPATHCTHAGPGGDGACGSNCEGFCTITLDACEGRPDADTYASIAECMTACEGFDDSESYDISDVGGDTLACRLYHAQVGTIDPVTHCGHTQPVSATCN